MFDDIEVSYSTDIQTTFYNFFFCRDTLQEKDLSILCFGSNMSPNWVPRLESTVKGYNLPRWTSVDGWHIAVRVSITTGCQLSYYIDNAMLMHIKTNRYWKIIITRYDDGVYSSSLTRDPTKRNRRCESYRMH